MGEWCVMCGPGPAKLGYGGKHGGSLGRYDGVGGYMGRPR